MKIEPKRINSLLQNLLQKDDVRIFIDTCSMMNDGFDDLLDSLIPILDVNHKKLVIPNSCIKEIIKKKKHKENPTLSKKAESALDSLEIIRQFIDVRGNVNDGAFADTVFLCVFTQFRLKYNLILITEDKNLKADVLGLNNTKSVLGKRVYVFNIKEALSMNRQGVTSVPDTPIALSSLPQQNDFVYTLDGKRIKLVENLKAGGEGSIYKIDMDSNLVAKIYLKGKLTERKKPRFQL